MHVKDKCIYLHGNQLVIHERGQCALNNELNPFQSCMVDKAHVVFDSGTDVFFHNYNNLSCLPIVEGASILYGRAPLIHNPIDTTNNTKFHCNYDFVSGAIDDAFSSLIFEPDGYIHTEFTLMHKFFVDYMATGSNKLFMQSVKQFPQLQCLDLGGVKVGQDAFHTLPNGNEVFDTSIYGTRCGRHFVGDSNINTNDISILFWSYFNYPPYNDKTQTVDYIGENYTSDDTHDNCFASNVSETDSIESNENKLFTLDTTDDDIVIELDSFVSTYIKINNLKARVIIEKPSIDCASLIQYDYSHSDFTVINLQQSPPLNACPITVRLDPDNTSKSHACISRDSNIMAFNKSMVFGNDYCFEVSKSHGQSHINTNVPNFRAPIVASVVSLFVMNIIILRNMFYKLRSTLAS